MKKALCLILAAILILISFPAFAGASFSSDASIGAEYVILMEAETGTVLYEKNAHKQAFPASTTKIMTCILALENGNLDDEVVVGKVTNRGSVMGLSEGEKLTLRQLIYGMMLISGNDAAQAIAEHISGSVTDFVALMNQKAQELGMNDTNFVTPNGLHKEDHYTTAYDFALLTRYAMQNADFRAIVKRTEFNISSTNRNKSGYQLVNSNKLLTTKAGAKSYEYRYATGVKTGDTDYAGKCLAATATKDGVTLIAILFHETDGDRRFTTCANMFDWGFEQFSSCQVSELGLPSSAEVTISNCSFDDPENGRLSLSIDLGDQKISGTKEKIDAIRANVSGISLSVKPVKNLAAPVTSGEKVAIVDYVYNGETLFSADAFATRDIAALGVSPTDQPSTTAPLIQSPVTPEKKQSSWLFWILIILVILLILIIVRIIANRRRAARRARARARSRQKSGNGNYTTYRARR